MAISIDDIYTERLFLREIVESDAKKIVEWRSEPDVYRFFKYPHRISIEEHLIWFQSNYSFDENRYEWMCIEKKSMHEIGVFGLLFECDSAEINYLLSPDAQCRGFASEAIFSLMEYAKSKWGIKKFFAEIHKDNASSIALVNRLGFQLDNENDVFEIYSIEISL